MEKINIAELLKDCPEGMELDCTMYDDVYFDYVDELNIIHCYIQHETHRTSITLNQHGTPNSDIKSKCVIFPKGKTTWEGFKRPFKDGEIIATDLGSVFILKSCLEDEIHYHSYIGVTCYNEIREQQIPFAYKHVCHLATEEEKIKLFQAIRANDYKWNPETKTLETLIGFKDGDVIANDRYIAIFHKFKEGHMYYHCWYNNDSNNSKFKIDFGIGYIYEYRLASEKEKVKLLQVIKDNGYKWNLETKTLEKLPKFKVGDIITNGNIISVINQITKDSYILDIKDDEICFNYVFFKDQDNWELVPNKFDINTLVPFESKVLVRNRHDSVWAPAFWGYYSKEYARSFVVAGGNTFEQCIPYEGNEHLLNSNKNCDEYYKTWK